MTFADISPQGGIFQIIHPWQKEDQITTSLAANQLSQKTPVFIHNTGFGSGSPWKPD
jgi:hypothetical protein